MTDRLTRLREKMAAHKLDGFVVGAPAEDIFHTLAANRRYLSGFTGSMGWLLISTDAAFIAVDFRYVEQAEREAPNFTVHQTVGGIDRWFAALVGEASLADKRIGFEANDMTVASFQAMKKAVESMPATDRPKLLAAPPIVQELRVIKDAEEIAALQSAVDIGDAAFSAVVERSSPAGPRRRIAWEIEKHARENGAEHMSFPTIVAAGPHGAMPHAMPRDHAVKDGDGIVIDMGVIVDGYCSDLTRTIVVRQARPEVPRDLRHRPHGPAYGRRAGPHRHERRRGAHAGTQRHRGGRLRRELRPRPRPRRRPPHPRGATPRSALERRTQGRYGRDDRARVSTSPAGAAFASRTRWCSRTAALASCPTPPN